MKVNRGEIWFYKGKQQEGHVQSGSRPVLIIQNNTGNSNSNTTIVAFLTSTVKKEMETHVTIEPDKRNGLSKKSCVLLEQIKTIDKRFLIARMGKADISVMVRVDEALKKSLGLRLSL